ncbi:hypothetical protein M0805_006173 [Coniferiporia weirii]|nr:hypothetical protein M0805_006173 [Coniferiporia weirii]
MLSLRAAPILGTTSHQIALYRNIFKRSIAFTLPPYAALSSYRTFFQASKAQFPKAQSASPLGLIGVQAALRAASDPSFIPRATLLEKEFSLAGRVAVVTGAQRGLGLEISEALAEAGATVYCLDLPTKPDESFSATQTYVSKLGLIDGARLEYASVDVTDQNAVWNAVEKIAEKEKRMDVCIAGAGIIRAEGCLDHSAATFNEVMSVNVNGTLYTAQAAGRQMVKFGASGSIVLIASMAGSVALQDLPCIAYNTSKSAVVQMGRSMACELGPKGIRVNTLSPGYIYSPMTSPLIEKKEQVVEEWSSENPLGRIGRPDELRGVVTWLASDASTFCTGSDILVTGGHTAW